MPEFLNYKLSKGFVMFLILTLLSLRPGHLRQQWPDISVLVQASAPEPAKLEAVLVHSCPYVF